MSESGKLYAVMRDYNQSLCEWSGEPAPMTLARAIELAEKWAATYGESYRVIEIPYVYLAKSRGPNV